MILILSLFFQACLVNTDPDYVDKEHVAITIKMQKKIRRGLCKSGKRELMVAPFLPSAIREGLVNNYLES